MAEKNFIVKGALETRETVSFDSNAAIDGDLSVTGAVTVTGDISFSNVASGTVPSSTLTGTIDSARIPILTTADIITAPGGATFDSNTIPPLAPDMFKGAGAGEFLDSDFIPPLNTADIGGGIFDSARIPQLTSGDIQGLDASDVTTGEFDSARIPPLSPDMFNAVGGSGALDSSFIPPLNTADITGGTFDSARMPNLKLGTDTNGFYVRSVTAGAGIQSLSAAAESVDQTIKVDSSFVTGLLSGGDGITVSGGQVSLNSSDSATFTNITASGQFNIMDSANGLDAAYISADRGSGVVFHTHAHNVDGGMKFVIHGSVEDSDRLVIYKDSGISVEGAVIHNVGTPVNSSDAANKSYVDAVVEGLHIHAPARVATVQQLLDDDKVNSVTYNNGTDGVGAYFDFLGVFDSVDGVNLNTGDRIVVKNETIEAYNGIYVVNSTNRITRADDFDTPAEIAGGDFIFVQEGTVNGGHGYAQTQTITSTRLGDSDILFVQFSGAEKITAGAGMSKNGNQLDVELASASGLSFDAVGVGGRLQIDAADNTVEVVSTGVRIPQSNGGIAIEHLDLDGSAFSGATPFTVAATLNATSETLDDLSSYDGTNYQFFTQARADSAVGQYAPNHVTDAYIEARRPAETIFTVVDNGSSTAYNFTGDGFPQSRSNPQLVLTPGKTYKFEVNASGHPFWIQKTAGAYSAANVVGTDSGITNNGAASGNIFYTPPMDAEAPTKLYYVCQNHSGMSGEIVFSGAHDSDLTQNQIDSAFANNLSGTSNEIAITTVGSSNTIGLADNVVVPTSLKIGTKPVLHVDSGGFYADISTTGNLAVGKRTPSTIVDVEGDAPIITVTDTPSASSLTVKVDNSTATYNVPSRHTFYTDTNVIGAKIDNGRLLVGNYAPSSTHPTLQVYRSGNNQALGMFKQLSGTADAVISVGNTQRTYIVGVDYSQNHAFAISSRATGDPDHSPSGMMFVLTPDGDMTLTRNAVINGFTTMNDSATVNGNFTVAAGNTVAFQNTTGTAPFTVASTTKVTNLNADLLDGQTGDYYRINIYDSAGVLLNS